MTSGRPAPAGGSFRRRARLYFILGASFTALAAIILIFRPQPKQYTPGADEEASESITRRLERGLPEGVPDIRFVDVAAEAGIRFRHFNGTRSIQLPEDMGSGAAWGDFDNDGDPDLFLVNESGPLTEAGGAPADSPARSALYRNEGDGTFVDVTEASGVVVRGCGMGAAWGDYDGDGFLDLVVTSYGTNRLFRNSGDGTFADTSAEVGIGGRSGFWTGASWADYDRDGDLDLHICGYVQYRFDEVLSQKSSRQYQAVVPSTLNPSSYPPQRNLLLRNEGGRFVDVAAEAGVENSRGRSLSAVWTDFDSDGWPDLYVANDVSDNAMFSNRRDGTFTDVSHSAWVADYRGAMGIAVGDWDNDSDFDIVVTHWLAQENALYDNQVGVITATRDEPMHFIDQADLNGLGQIALDYIGWGTGFIDYDNDGRLDLLVANGSTFQMSDDPTRLVPMRQLLFWNGGPDKGFFEVGEVSGEAFAVEEVGRGAAFADYDGDGDIDFLLAPNGGPARLLRNEGGNESGWLRVVLRGRPAGTRRAGDGTGHATPTFAEGALVEITIGAQTQIRTVGLGGSYLSQSPPGEVMFGLGDAESVDRIVVRWPDGLEQTFQNVAARSTLRIEEGEEPSIRTSRRTAKLSREETVRFWKSFNRATTLRIGGDCREALAVYREALGINPSHEDSLYYSGHCLWDTGSIEEARLSFRKLLAVNPESVRAHVALASALVAPDGAGALDLVAAEKHLRRAHQINLEETGPMVRLGEILVLRGDRAQAAEWLEAAARTNPRSVEAACLAGYLRWMRQDEKGARDFYLKAVAAMRVVAPAGGVPGEGDTRRESDPPPRNGKRTAHRSAIGATLLGALCADLGRGRVDAEDLPDGSTGDDMTGIDLEVLFSPLHDRVSDLERRASSSP